MEASDNVHTESMHPINAKDVALFAKIDAVLAEQETQDRHRLIDHVLAMNEVFIEPVV